MPAAPCGRDYASWATPTRKCAGLGYSDKGAAWRAVQNVLVETARAQRTEELRVQQLAELAELRRVMWRTVE